VITAANLPISGNRFTPLSYVIALNAGADWSTATVLMHVRQLPDQIGTPLLTLNSGAEITLSYSAPNTSITILVPELDMEALPAAAETGQDLVLHYDMHITPPSGTKAVYFRGTFTVLAGVTQ